MKFLDNSSHNITTIEQIIQISNNFEIGQQTVNKLTSELLWKTHYNWKLCVF